MRSSSRERMLCTFCQARIPIQPFCMECGNPTAYASSEERIQFELEKWSLREAEPKPDRVIDLTQFDKPKAEKPAPRRQPRMKQPLHPETWPVAPAAPPPAVPSSTGSDKWRRAFRPLPDEIIGFAKEGRCGPEKATLVITKYRVATVQGHTARWIPLESVQDIAIVEGRQPRLVVGGSIEVLGFRHPDRKLLESIQKVLEHEVRLGVQPDSDRHHPDLMQQWAEQVTDVWKAPFRTVRLWVRRHPAAAAIFH